MQDSSKCLCPPDAAPQPRAPRVSAREDVLALPALPCSSHHISTANIPTARDAFAMSWLSQAMPVHVSGQCPHGGHGLLGDFARAHVSSSRTEIHFIIRHVPPLCMKTEKNRKSNFIFTRNKKNTSLIMYLYIIKHTSLIIRLPSDPGYCKCVLSHHAPWNSLQQWGARLNPRGSLKACQGPQKEINRLFACKSTHNHNRFYILKSFH